MTREQIKAIFLANRYLQDVEQAIRDSGTEVVK